jgi:hypothetical protein
MSGRPNADEHPDLPDSTIPEGRAAHGAGMSFIDNPYKQWGESKWGWAMGWIEAENAAWARAREQRAAVVIVIA